MKGTVVLAVESYFALEIGHLFRCSTATSTNLFPVLDVFNGPEMSKQEVGNNPITGARRLVWYVESLLAC